MERVGNILKYVNFHFWAKCNFNCKYCFARFESNLRTLGKDDCLEIIRLLKKHGTEKINFAGGEPTLCPFLGHLIKFAKELGLITSIISNGTGINQEFISNYGDCLDWVGLSIDSGKEFTLKKLGRGNGKLIPKIISISNLIKKSNIKLKINSVITKLNFNEDLSQLIGILNPDRWKVFQMLEIKNQNHQNLGNLIITESEFNHFVSRHEALNPIAENNNLMIESYLMIDPFGRFYQNNRDYSYYYSRPILEVGIQDALSDIHFDYSKFIKRGGIYT